METLKDLRKQKGLTLYQTARALNVSIRTILRYEEGTRQINIKQALQLATLYECSVQEIIDAQLNSYR